MDLPSEVLLAFISGLLTPLGAVCVLPLYPAYLAFLARGGEPGRAGIPPLGTALLATAGVISAMACTGFLVTFVLRTSLGTFLAAISPWLYVILLGAGIILITGLFPSLPAIGLPSRRDGPGGAFLFGAFFGIISLPCNPGPILLLFSIAAASGTSLSQVPVFLAFGIGICFPLMVLAAIPVAIGRNMTSWLVAHRRGIEIATGALMIAVAVISLIFHG